MIVQEIAPVIVAAIVPPASAIAVQIRVMPEAASAGTRDVGGGGRDANVGRDVGGGSRDISSGRASAGTSDRGGGGNYGGGGGNYGSSGSAFGGGSGASARSSSSRGSSSMASSRGGGGGGARAWGWRARRWRSAMTSHLTMRLSQPEGKLVMINRVHFRFKRASLSAAFVLCTLGISTAFARDTRTAHFCHRRRSRHCIGAGGQERRPGGNTRGAWQRRRELALIRRCHRRPSDGRALRRSL